jgi:subtilisin family serine protease
MKRNVLVAVMVVSLAFAPLTTSAQLLGSNPADSLTQQEATVDGELQPEWLVQYENDSATSLQSWAESTPERELLSIDNTSNTAVVAASPDQAGATFLAGILNSGLAATNYVERVEPNFRLSRTDPVSLQSEDEVDGPGLSVTQQARAALSGGDWNSDGVAYSGDANRTTMAESRDVLGVDNVRETGEGVTVAVVDTGISTADGRVFGNGSSGSDLRVLNSSKNFITGETVRENGTDAVADGNGHGTWAASAIAANSSNSTHDGVAPDASLLVLKALADDGSGATSDITAAIRYAADEGADVISLSLGSPIYSESLADAVQYARDNGSVVVVAVGNSARTQPVGIASPAEVEGAIGVAATTGESAKNASVAYFSQRSGQVAADGHIDTPEEVDVAAPGMRTVAQTPTESGRVDESTLSGTSMATPMVAGSVALAREAHPDWGVNETTKRVRKSARRMNNTAVAEVGGGMSAADRLVAGTNTSQSQSDAMDTGAQGRQQLYESIAASTGGLWARVSRSATSAL